MEKNDAINIVEDYSSVIIEAKRKAIEGEGLKILTPKQMLQRLPIALAQVKAVNNSKHLLSEIRHTQNV